MTEEAEGTRDKAAAFGFVGQGKDGTAGGSPAARGLFFFRGASRR